MAVILCNTARAQGAEPSHNHLYGRLALGAAYVRVDTNSRYTGPQHAVGVASQLDLGVRLTRALRVHGTFVFDRARDSDYSSGRSDALGMLGIGAGATLNIAGFDVGASVGPQWTTYGQPYGAAAIFSIDNGTYEAVVDKNRSTKTEGVGLFMSGSLGYVLKAFDPWALGVHVFARYHKRADATVSIPICTGPCSIIRDEPEGYQLGAAMSLSFDGAPLL